VPSFRFVLGFLINNMISASDPLLMRRFLQANLRLRARRISFAILIIILF